MSSRLGNRSKFGLKRLSTMINNKKMDATPSPKSAATIMLGKPQTNTAIKSEMEYSKDPSAISPRKSA